MTNSRSKILDSNVQILSCRLELVMRFRAIISMA